MPRLNRTLLKECPFPDGLIISPSIKRPETVLQFGEGVFLRAFVDDIFDEMNARGLYNGSIVIVKPIAPESKPLQYLNEQDGLYTLRLRGRAHQAEINRMKVITSVSRAIDPYCDYAAYLNCAKNPDLRVIVSNTTEAGIAYDPDDRLTLQPQRSFPGKLTAFLYERWQAFNGDNEKGFIILPCELIDDNGAVLKEIVLRYTREWALPDAFRDWINTANLFCGTLVDRIVTGYPHDDIQALTQSLGYEDKAFDTAEPFGLWVIEGSPSLSEELPFDQLDLPRVIFADDVKPYKIQKVRLLNGTHTMSVLTGVLCGLEYVTDMLNDSVFLHYMKTGLMGEILPATVRYLPETQLTAFADAVLERFANPFIRHRLLNIAMNTTSKFKARILPTVYDYINLFNQPPRLLVFAFASLLRYYKGELKDGLTVGTTDPIQDGKEYTITDGENPLLFFRNAWEAFDGTEDSARLLTEAVCANESLWGRDLNKLCGFSSMAAAFLWGMLKDGVKETMNRLFLHRIHPTDNVYVTLCDRTVDNTALNAGHKLAATDIPKGQAVIKYGFPIGVATCAIQEGEWVHTHNIKSLLTGEDSSVNILNEPGRDSAFDFNAAQINAAGIKPPTFHGYRRKDGRVGIRNEIWIIHTVGCVNGTAEAIAREANIRFAMQTDGIYAFPHPYGCSQMGDDQVSTQQILAGLCRHPNAGGVLVLGLGCENNHTGVFQEFLGEIDPARVKFLNMQDADNEREQALSLIGLLAAEMQKDTRVEVSVSQLTIGLKCGGSDGFSGITANPLLGYLSDYLVAYGGTALMTEVPEMFGAEGLLFNRCASPRVQTEVVKLIDHFKQYYTGHGQPIDENPSPGNKAGGISTLAEKSLGCTQKGGSSPIRQVLPYGGTVSGSESAQGLCLLAAPGNDMVAVTALASAGAQLILFTTGRGTPLGSPVPVIKISTNTALFQKKQHWIDFDAGRLLTGSGMEELTGELLTLVRRVASGEERTRSEINGMRDFTIWKNGVTL